MVLFVALGILTFVILFPLIANVSYWFETLGYRFGKGQIQQIADD
jgi:hypothetical protein